MFWDSSALVPLLVSELRSAETARLLEGDRAPVAWWASPVECASALHRRHREGGLTRAELAAALARLRQLVPALACILPVDAVRARAGGLFSLHPLRAADALQLAAALVWTEGLPDGERFACLDRRLREAARAQGFTVVPGDELPLMAHDAPRRARRRRTQPADPPQ
jgi:hypothetical protein